MVLPTTKDFRNFARICTVYAHQYLSGITPFVQPIPNAGVHTRFPTADEIKHQRTRRERDMWQQEAIEQAMEVTNGIFKIQDLEIRWDAERKEYEAEREELRAMLQQEKIKTQASERSRHIAVSSLQDRCKSVKTRLVEDGNRIKGMLHKTECELAEVRSYAEELMQQVEDLEQTVVRLKNDETIETVSRKLSTALSVMSQVVPVRPTEGQSVDEKLRDLLDKLQDLVREVLSRRENSDRMTGRIFKMEEERMMWALGPENWSGYVELHEFGKEGSSGDREPAASEEGYIEKGFKTEGRKRLSLR